MARAAEGWDGDNPWPRQSIRHPTGVSRCRGRRSRGWASAMVGDLSWLYRTICPQTRSDNGTHEIDLAMLGATDPVGVLSQREPGRIQMR